MALHSKGLFLVWVPVHRGFIGGSAHAVLTWEDRLRAPPSGTLLIAEAGERKVENPAEALRRFYPEGTPSIFHSYLIGQNKSYGHAKLQGDGDVQASPIPERGEPDPGD